VPALQVDNNSSFGNVVARNGGLPSDKLWFFKLDTDIFGGAIFGPVRGVTVPSYTMPADASQSGAT
jgi:hypothetical protein